MKKTKTRKGRTSRATKKAVKNNRHSLKRDPIFIAGVIVLVLLVALLVKDLAIAPAKTITANEINEENQIGNYQAEPENLFPTQTNQLTTATIASPMAIRVSENTNDYNK